MTNLKTPTKEVKRVNTLTDQKLIRVKTSMKTYTTKSPSVVIAPSCIKLAVQLAHFHGQPAMYWTQATASIGIRVIKETQLAQAAKNPSKGPWLY